MVPNVETAQTTEATSLPMVSPSQDFLDLPTEQQKILRKYVMGVQVAQPIDLVGRPLVLVEPSKILQTEYSRSIEELRDEINDLSVSISYESGYPTIEAVPLWEPLPWESDREFELFELYRDQAEGTFSRSLYKLSKTANVGISELETLRQVNHWLIRTKAYDNYSTIRYTEQLETERRRVEREQLETGRVLALKSIEVFERYSDMITPKLALEILKEANKMQRLGVGLQADKPGTWVGPNVSGAGVNINVNTNAMGNNAAASVSIEQGSTTNVDEDRQRLADLLNVMNSIGVLSPKGVEAMNADTIIDVDIEEDDTDE